MVADLKAIRLPLFKFTFSDGTIPEEKQSLREWQNETLQIVHSLLVILSATDLQKLTPDELALIYSILQSIINPEEWINKDIAKLSKEILKQLPPPNFEIVQLTILNHIKPLFAQIPHTRIDSNTGRSRQRPAGGPSGSLDFYEGQDWKKRPGLSYLITWCIQSLQKDEYEKVWHLIVPPSMTFLDDYEAYYKLRGIEIISQFIDRVPTGLIERTGIDGLIKTSLNGALLYLHSPLTPAIIRVSAPALIRLIKMTTLPGSAQRFDQLCALLGDGIISGVWIYAYQDFETIEASLLVLSQVVDELGVGVARYLKTIIQQLVQYLSMSGGESVVRIQMAALKLLGVVLIACRPRIHAWNTMILDGISRCWVSLHDQKVPENEELSILLIQMVENLITSVPSTKVHCQNLITLDKQMFAPLFSHPPAV